ncbi:unnamed protein product, partial [Mesorhabditis spiculigera]
MSATLGLGCYILTAKANIFLVPEEPEAQIEVLKIPEEATKGADGKDVEDFEIICSTKEVAQSSMFAVGTSAKTCVIYHAKPGQLEVCRWFRVPKAPTSIVFDNRGNVVVGDRSGNVTQYRCTEAHMGRHENDEDCKFEGSPLAGGVTMILDVAFSADFKYLLTADRDEKIKVYRYPDCSAMYAVAFGHTEYVRSVDVYDRTVVSGGGDGRLYLHDLHDGTQLFTTNKLGEKPIRRLSIVEIEGFPNLFVTFEASPRLYVFGLTAKNNLELKDAVEAQSPIVDFHVIADRNSILLLTRDGLDIYNPSDNTTIRRTSSELVEAVTTIAEELSLFKNVTHQNMQEYHERKAKKMANVAEKKAAVKIKS